MDTRRPAGNQTTDAALKDQTFYMSNMAPQLPKLNRSAWKALETQTRAWVKQFGHAYEWTGPVFYDPKEDNSATANGTVDFKTIGKDSVAVPTHFYKIVVVKDGDHFKSIAFVMPIRTTRALSSRAVHKVYPVDRTAYRPELHAEPDRRRE